MIGVLLRRLRVDRLSRLSGHQVEGQMRKRADEEEG
jgi:hypothetical protein